MAKLQNTDILKNNKGQSAVEYILLLVVLSALGISFNNNRRFKDFIGGEKGLFVAMRKGMEYSYRYGRPLDNTIDADGKMEFSYGSRNHDLYYNTQEAKTRFFTGLDAYGR